MKYSNAERYHKRRLVEINLRNHIQCKQELHNLRDAIIEGSSFQEVAVQSGGTSNVTANKAIQLLTSTELIEVAKRAAAIDIGMDMLRLKARPDKDLHKLISMKYFDKKFSDIAIASSIGVSDRTFRRWHGEAVDIIGTSLGWKL